MTQKAEQYAGLAGLDPVFIYGAMRSGTTVFRLMLEAHGEISNPGEVDFLFEFLHRDGSHPSGWRYDLAELRLARIFQSYTLDIPEGRDGLDLLADFLRQLQARAPGTVMSLNVHHKIDRILQIFPDTKIIHVLRDPRDVARSSVPMGWAARPYHGVDHWVATEQAWDRGSHAANPAQVLNLHYEALFADIETELAKVCDSLDLKYNPDMLRYHENTTYAAPDPRLVELWRRKCSLDEVALVEGKAGDLMRARGYEPTGEGRVPGRLEDFKLRIETKLFRYKFNMRRFGAKLFLMEKLTRKLGLRAMYEPIRCRMNDIHPAQLK